MSLKNRRGNRVGFTPYKLVIGQNPRVPHELLSDDPVDEVGLQELNRDDADLNSPAKACRQKNENQRPCPHADGHPHGKGTASIGGYGSTASRSKLSPWAMGVRVAKRCVWSKRSNWRSITLPEGWSMTCCSSRWHRVLGVNERTTSEVCTRADS